METYPLPDLAELLGVPFTRIRQYRKERRFGVLQEHGKPVVPADFFHTVAGRVEMFDAVPGTITLLMDGGMNEAEACEWLVSEHDALGTTPLQVLRSGGHHRVNNLALAEAF